MAQKILFLGLLLVLTGCIAAYESEEQYDLEDSVAPAGDVTVEDLERATLPQLNWRGKSFLLRGARFLKRKLAFLARRLRHNKVALRQVHFEATKSLCQVAKPRGCPVTCPKIQKRPSCAARNNRNLARRERHLASLYAEAYIAYLKIALQYQKDKFKTLAGKHLALVKKNKRLQLAHEKAKKDLQKAQKSLANKKKQLKNTKAALGQCKKNVKSTVPIEAKAKKEHDDVARKVAQTETVRDQHRTRAATAKKQADDADKEAEAAKRRVAAATKKLSELCGYKDGCDVCNGDGSSCAKTRAPSQCHAVGDPHFRSFDGYVYDFQNDGEYILSRLNKPYRFEVQNRQVGRCCANGAGGGGPRCNSAVAVMGNGHVLSTHVAWLNNGRQISVDGNMRGVDGNWVHIGNGALRMRHMGGNQMEIFYCWNNKDCDTRVFFTWSSCHMDIYVLGRWQFSTGSSLDGLCGNYNANAGDDPQFVNSWANYKVDGTDRSFFTNRGFRKISELSEEEAMTEEDLDETEGLHRLTRPMAVPKPVYIHHSNKITPRGQASSEDLQLLSQAKADVKDEACKTACSEFPETSATYKDCCFDALNGMDIGEVKNIFEKESVMDSYKKFVQCKFVFRPEQVNILGTGIPGSKWGSGFSVMFQFAPEKGADDASAVLNRGEMFQVTQEGESLRFNAGGATCVSETLKLGKYTQFTATVSATGVLQVYRHGKPECSGEGSGSLVVTADSLVNCKAGDKCAVGQIAGLAWAPLTLSETENRVLFAERHVSSNCRE